MSKSNRSSASQFLHDLITLDFDKLDIYTGLRGVTVLAPLLVLGLITGHASQASLVILGAIWLIVIDEMRSPGHRTRALLSVSVIYASIYAIGMLVSMVDYLIMPLLALGLFFMSYLRVFPQGYILLLFSGLMFVIAITTPHATLTRTAQDSLLVLIGGLWVILAGAILPAHKFSKSGRTTNQSVHEQHPQPQPPPKLTRQDRYNLLKSNLSIHSQYFQFALALALTAVVGLLIAQWFNLIQQDWVVISIVVILMPVHFGISLAFDRVVHRIIGTIIGAMIVIIITNTTDNEWLLTILLLLFACAYASMVKIGNYAFRMLLVTVVALLFSDLRNPSLNSITTTARMENILIGCLLSLLTAFIIWIVPKFNSNRALRNAGQ